MTIETRWRCGLRLAPSAPPSIGASPSHRRPFVGSGSSFQRFIRDIAADQVGVIPVKISRGFHGFAPVRPQPQRGKQVQGHLSSAELGKVCHPTHTRPIRQRAASPPTVRQPPANAQITPPTPTPAYTPTPRLPPHQPAVPPRAPPPIPPSRSCQRQGTPTRCASLRLTSSRLHLDQQSPCHRQRANARRRHATAKISSSTTYVSEAPEIRHPFRRTPPWRTYPRLVSVEIATEIALSARRPRPYLQDRRQGWRQTLRIQALHTDAIAAPERVPWIRCRAHALHCLPIGTALTGSLYRRIHCLRSRVSARASRVVAAPLAWPRSSTVWKSLKPRPK
jgi:hypothetical protein